MISEAPRPRAGILEIQPYVGGKAEAAGGKPAVKLSSNESAIGPSPRAQAVYRDLAGDLHRYPDGGSTALRQAIGRRHNIDPSTIVCGAGSDELIALVIKAYAGGGDEVLYSAHGFLMYKLGALAAGASPVTAPETGLKADVDALLARVTSRTRLVFVANPNNPTGSYLAASEIERLHRGLPSDVILVIDAAYGEFVREPDYTDGLQLSLSAPNVVMTRTFSKLHGLAALRVGWMTAGPGIVDIVNRVRGPFNVSMAAQGAAVAALEDVEHQEAARAHNERWLPWLRGEIAATGLVVHPSVGNFVLVQFPDGPERNATAANDFLERNGVIPRMMHAYGLAHCLRLTVGLEAENRLVVDVLKRFMAAGSRP